MFILYNNNCNQLLKAVVAGITRKHGGVPFTHCIVNHSKQNYIGYSRKL